MGDTFFEEPILNSPYEEPSLHHVLDDVGQPMSCPPMEGRRSSTYIAPVPKPRNRCAGEVDDEQMGLKLYERDGLSSESQEYNPTTIINDMRVHLNSWRLLPNSRDWGVTPVTVRLLRHWRSGDNFEGVRPFFCQVEAAETVIWLTEVAKGHGSYKYFWRYLEDGNEGANPDLLRLAMKMATGAGKTTVMAMLIAWQTLNAVRYPRRKVFTRGFLVVTPGITIKDRLRVLSPNDSDSYYGGRNLVPLDMLQDLGKAKIVITNYHVFQLRDVLGVNKTTRSLLGGRDDSIRSKETEGQMVCRVAKELVGIRNIVVINDEAHHCYREKSEGEGEKLSGDERREAKENNEAARVWVSGIEAFSRVLGKGEGGVSVVYDLSATPFFLSGSGWAEGTLFPWTVSDFSLMDAIESGIVKLPRVPVDDNIPGEDMPIFRNLWEHIGKDMPKKGRQVLNPGEGFPDKLQTALWSLYGHYEKVDREWKRVGIEEPPVFIVVCNNTSTSRWIYEWISGWQRLNEDDELVFRNSGHLELFSNFDEHGQALAKPKTLLIDSHQIESGGDLDKNFREMAKREIELFKRERVQRGERGDISDSELLREVMNTVGKRGRLGGEIRCVVSVSMLTEGWDANTVTHILGVRAFGTQLLCEQVVGRALRRLSYDLNERGLFESEYADILGIPFDFTAKAVVSTPKPPKRSTHVKALKESEGLEIRFPRVVGYRTELPEGSLSAEFTDLSFYEIDHDKVGASQTLMSGIVGEGHTLSLEEAQKMRPSTIAYHLSKEVLHRYFVDEDGEVKYSLFGQVNRICRRWLDEGYLECPGDTAPWMLSFYPEIAAQACEKIVAAIVRAEGGEERVKVVIDSHNEEGSTRHVNFVTTKSVRKTDPRFCHVNYVVSDSGWEAEFARCAENHDRVVSYVKNQGLGFVVPYKDGDVAREYIPDFIVRVDDGRGGDDLLNVIVEIKGFRDDKEKLKRMTVEEKWIPGVNGLGKYGRWAFGQFESVYEIDREFRELVEGVVAGAKGGMGG